MQRNRGYDKRRELADSPRSCRRGACGRRLRSKRLLQQRDLAGMIDRVLQRPGDLAEFRTLLPGNRFLEIFVSQPRVSVGELALRLLEAFDGALPGNLRHVSPVVDGIALHNCSPDAPSHDVIPRSDVHHELEDGMRTSDGMRFRLLVSDALEQIAQRRAVPRYPSKCAVQLIE